MAVRQILVRRLTTQRGTLQYLTLDDVRVAFRIRYSKYEDRFYLWYVAPNSEVISGPRKLVGGIDISRGLKHDERIPPGELFVHHPDREPMTLANVDGDARLLYREAAT